MDRPTCIRIFRTIKLFRSTKTASPYSSSEDICLVTNRFVIALQNIIYSYLVFQIKVKCLPDAPYFLAWRSINFFNCPNAFMYCTQVLVFKQDQEEFHLIPN